MKIEMKRQGRRVLPLMLVAVGMLALVGFETTRVEIREGNENDHDVAIYREDGALVFRDAVVGAPVSLSDLAANTGDHGTMTGLGDDDHTQYLNSTRHSSAHGVAFNNTLGVSGDVGGNTTLGAHLADPDIHLNGSADAIISGDWLFTEDTVFRGGAPVIDDASSITSREVIFRTPGHDASLGYSPGNERFEFSDPFYAPGFQAPSISSTNLVAQDLLSGRVGGVRTGEIEGFTSIEGIAHGDLLSRSQDEDVTGSWDFLSTTKVQESSASANLEGTALYVEMDAEMDLDDDLEGATRFGAAVGIAVSADGTGNLTEALVAGMMAQSATDLDGVGVVSGTSVGVVGQASSDHPGMAAIGVAGVAGASASGSPRVAVLGVLDDNALTDGNSIPAGNHAGVFLGDVHVSDAASVTCVAVRVTNGSGATIEKGAAVSWIGDFEVAVADSVTSATAGISLDDALNGEGLRVAVAGLAEVSTSSTISAGETLAWDGSGAVVAVDEDDPTIGTAVEGNAGSGMVWVQVLP